MTKKHYGSTATKFTDDKVIAFATCSCGWKSEEDVCELDEVDEDYEIRDVVQVMGALTEIRLKQHLERVENEALND